MYRQRQTEKVVDVKEVCEVGDFQFTSKEEETLTKLFDVLTAQQIEAARLESTGATFQNIGAAIGITPKTITAWHQNKNYIEARNLFLFIINKTGLQFRLNLQKMILAPVYVELTRRLHDPENPIKNYDIKQLLEIIRIIGKEIRLDTASGGFNEDDDELKDLQERKERRQKFSHAKQAEAIDDLKSDKNIINFPSGTDG